MNKYSNMNFIKAPSTNEMFGLEDEIGSFVEIKVNKLVPYHTNGVNPFSMERNRNFLELIDSIKEDGIRTPISVRVDPIDSSKYEIISGHRRTEAAKELGLQKIPAIILDLDDNEAQKSLTLSNKYREEIKPSEKAKAYKMYLDAISKQGKRNDLTSGSEDHKLGASESVAEELGIGEKTVRRYAKLVELIPELMEMVDNEDFSVKAGEQFAYINEEMQSFICNLIHENKLNPSVAQATAVKNLLKEDSFTEDDIRELLGLKRNDVSEKVEDLTDTAKKIKINERSVTTYLPDFLHKKSTAIKYDYISKALTLYNTYLEGHLEEKKEWENRCL